MEHVAKIFSFYWDGFRSMGLGRTLWMIIIIKLIIIFGVLKIHFFPNYLNSNFITEDQKAAHVLENITQYHEQTRSAP